jgi:hypothetical protein
MFELDPKERWSYNDLERLGEIKNHFSNYEKLSKKDELAE